LPFAYLY
jgi:transposase